MSKLARGMTLAICFGVLAALGGSPPRTQEIDVDPPPGIHAQQDAWFAQLPPPPRYDPARKATMAAEETGRVLFKTVLGFLPYWIDPNEVTLRWDLLSTLAWFAVNCNPDGTLSNPHGWPDPGIIETAHANGVAVVLAVTCFDAEAIASILASPENRSRMVGELLSEAIDNDIEGVNIDFEGVPAEQKENLVRFMEELTATFHREIPGSNVTIDTPAIDWRGAFDYDQLAVNSDGLMIMAYNYHWTGGSTAGPVSPLTGYGQLNVTWTLDDYFEWGLPENKDKFILGVPYYAIRWPTDGYDPHAAATGRGRALFYDTAASEVETRYERRWDEESQTPFYVYEEGGSPYQTWYDDAESLGYKYDLVLERDIQGIGIWALGYDGTRPELWEAIETHFTLEENPPCPAETTARIAHRPDLLLPLRAFRDERLARMPGGNAWIGEYYRLAPRIERLLADHPALRWEAVGLLPDAAAMARSLLAGKGDAFDLFAFHRATRFLDDLIGATTDPELQRFFRKAGRLLRDFRASHD